MLTQARLKEVLHYDARTGVFVWRQPAGRWGRIPAGTVAGNISHPGICIRIDGKLYLAHRLVWLYVFGRWPDDQIDHRDLDRTNNALLNLREANNSQNQGNQPLDKTNKSGYKGVSWSKSCNKWLANISIDNKSKYLGLFDTPEDAHAAYVAAASAHFGNFMRAS